MRLEKHKTTDPVEKKRPSEPGRFGKKILEPGANDGYGLVGVVVGVAGLAAGLC